MLLMIYRKVAGLQEILNGKLKLWQIFSRSRRRWGVGFVKSFKYFWYSTNKIDTSYLLLNRRCFSVN